MGTRPARLLLPALAVLLTATACGSGSSGPDPAPAADSLAQALASGDLSGLAFAGTTPAAADQQYGDTVSGLGSVTPKVSVSGVSRDSDSTATATLSWSWPLGSGWSYRSTVPMKLVGETWEVAWSPKIVEPSLDGTATLEASTVEAKRGDILGPGGVGLVTDRPVVRFGVDRTKVGPSRALDSARRLAQLVGIDVASYVKQVKRSGPKAFIQAIVFRREDAPSNLVGRATAIKGVDALSGAMPLGLTKEFAAPILGTVGPVTADMIKQNPGVYRVGDVAGLSGLEARYDAQLRGTPGVRVEAVGAGDKRHPVFETKPVNGTPLRLTMAPRLQMLAEHILSTVGPASAIIAIRPSTGEILAAANGPGNNGYNDATYGRFAPGSTFKTVDSLALAKKGVTPQSTVDCPTSVDVNGKIFTNDSFYPPSANGRITLATALANSCNTAYINERTSSVTTTWSTRQPRSAWGSTTTSASRRTSATSCHPPPRPRRRPT